MAEYLAPPESIQSAPAVTGELGPNVSYFVHPVTGETVTLPTSQAHIALGAGYQPASPQQVQHYDLVDKMSTGLGQVESGAESVARGATLGLSDLALRGLGVSGERLAAGEEANPGLSMLGNLAGTAATMEIGPVAKGLKLLGEGAQGAVGLGKAAGITKVVSTPFGEAAIPLAAEAAGFGRTIAAGAVKGAAEFAPFGAGNTISEGALGQLDGMDTGEVAEHLAANVGLSALTGGALGGVGGAARAGFEKVVRAPADSVIGKTLSKMGFEQQMDFDAPISTLRNAVQEQLRTGQTPAMPFLSPESGVKEWGWPSGGKAIKASGISADNFADAEKDSKTNVKAADQVIKDFDHEAATKTTSPEAFQDAWNFAKDLKNVPEAVKPALNDVSKGFIKDLTETASKDGPKGVSEMMLGIREDLVKLAKSAPEPAIQDAASRLADKLETQLTDPAKWGSRYAGYHDLSMRVDDLRDFLKNTGNIRENVPDFIKLGQGSPTGAKLVEDLQLWGGMDQSVRDSMGRLAGNEAAGKGVDKTALKELIQKSEAHATTTPPPPVTQAAPKARSPAMDMFGGALAGMVGHRLAAMAGGALGAAGLGMLAPIAAKTVGKVFRVALEHPDAIAGTLVKAYKAVQASSAAITTGAKALTATAAHEYSGSKAMEAQKLSQVTKALAGLANNPEALARHLQNIHPALADVAPKTHAALQTTEARAIQFLSSKLPQTQAHDILGTKAEVSPAARALFNRSFQAVVDPTSILRDARSGALTKEAVEAVQAVYPQMYAKMVHEVIQNITSTGKLPGYTIRPSVELLLGTSLTNHSDSFFSRCQSSFSAKQAQPTSASSSNVSSSSSLEKMSIAKRTAPTMPGRSNDIE